MNRINWVYILDNKGKNFFNLETQEQGSAGTSSTLMSRLIFSLQSIAKDLKANEMKSVEMGQNRYFLCKEQTTNYLFIVNTNRNADAGAITPVLQEIIDLYHERFKHAYEFSIDENIRQLNSFGDDVKQIINDKFKV
jgi:hypothetical protein